MPLTNFIPSPGKLLAAALLPLLPPLHASADIGVVIADPTTIGASTYTQAGHSLVYLSGVCAETPVHARLCRPGEQGSFVTMYPNFRERAPFAWNLTPASLYLQGSLTPGRRLLYASRPVKSALELSARDRYFSSVCIAARDCPQIPHSYWRDLVATTVDRDIFVYAVRTTPAQDQAAVDWLNRSPNVNHYNGVFNNCANFARSLINAILPHSVHRDILNDLGMMGPKAAARSFTHWALKRPDLDFHVLHFAQQPGDLPRCGTARSGTEAGFHTKKYLIPITLIGNHEFAGSLIAVYFLTGRFSLYRVFTRYPGPSVGQLPADASSADAAGESARGSVLQNSQISAEIGRDSVLGTPEQWQSFEIRFDALRSADLP